jgi:hypothetical protein
LGPISRESKKGDTVFFDVIVKPQTWRNVGYLLLAFPLGILYFTFLVTGLSLGFGLFITLLGIPVLVGVLAAAYGMGEFERTTTNALLDRHTPPSHRLAVSGGLWPKVKALVGSSETWKRVAYLFVEFPFGIVGFTLVTSAAAFFALITTPFFYTRSWWPTAADWPSEIWLIDTLWESVIVAVIGVVIGLVLLHVINGLARVWGEFASLMLGPTYRPTAPVPEATQPVAEAVPVQETPS